MLLLLLPASSYRKNLLTARVHTLSCSCCCVLRSSTVLEVGRNPRGWTTGLSHCYPTIPARGWRTLQKEKKKKKKKKKGEREREREKDYGSSRLSADNVYSGPRELLLRLVPWSATSGESASLDVPQRRRRGKKPTKTNSPALSLSFSLSLSLFLAVFFLLGKLSAGL